MCVCEFHVKWSAPGNCPFDGTVRTLSQSKSAYRFTGLVRKTKAKTRLAVAFFTRLFGPRKSRRTLEDQEAER